MHTGKQLPVYERSRMPLFSGSSSPQIHSSWTDWP